MIHEETIRNRHMAEIYFSIIPDCFPLCSYCHSIAGGDFL